MEADLLKNCKLSAKRCTSSSMRCLAFISCRANTYGTAHDAGLMGLICCLCMQVRCCHAFVALCCHAQVLWHGQEGGPFTCWESREDRVALPAAMAAQNMGNSKEVMVGKWP